MMRPVPDSQRVKEYLSYIRQDQPIAPICIGSINRLLDVIRPGRVNVIAGGPAVGKSTLCGQIAEGAAKSGCMVVLVTPELPSHVYYQKAIVRLSKTPLTVDVDTWLDLVPVRAAMYEYARGIGSHIVCVDRRMSVGELRTVIDAVANDHGEPLAVMVDWIQLMPPSDERLANDERLTIKETMQGLRLLATDYSASVFAVSSVQRQGYARKSIGLEMLGGAAAVEYYADTVIHLRRDVDGQNLIGARLIKNRYGRKGDATLVFDAPLATFRDA